MLLALNSLKLSAQSPPCKRKAFPVAASARRSSKLLASPANTIGGNASRVQRTDSSSSGFGYSGSCKAFLDFQLSMVHLPGAPESLVAEAVAVAEEEAAAAAGALGGLSDPTGFLEGSAE